MKDQVIDCLLLLVVLPALIVGPWGNQASAHYISQQHPLFLLFGIGSWGPSEQATTIVNPDGTYWVKTGDGRIRAGTWRVDGEGHVCVIGGGVFEGCFSVHKEPEGIRFKSPGGDFEFVQQPREDLPRNLLSNMQAKFFKGIIDRRAAIKTDRGGDEYAYLYRDGLITVVQPEGWTKTGGWWFTSAGLYCDDVEGVAHCAVIESVEKDRIVLLYDMEGEALRVDARIENRP